jgi:purine nucleoside permease
MYIAFRGNPFRARHGRRTILGDAGNNGARRLRSRIKPAAWLISAGLLLLCVGRGYASDLIAPKVLVLATYETGKDRGDSPGELQYWVERENLDQAIQVPGIDHPILTNGQGLYAMICGTTSRCAVQMMALAMDPRFDLRKTYFLLSGIGGIDPAAGTVGDVAWIGQVIDGDPIFEIDSREMPAAWPYGTIALGATEPGKAPAKLGSGQTAGVEEDSAGAVGQMVYQMNPSLVAWAYGLTKDLTLPDSPALAAWRARFKDNATAQHAPLVEEGTSVAADRFWHGTVMTKMAEDWAKMYTRGQGTFMIADCEDQGICLALAELQRLEKIDFQRLLVLRSASNFTVPPPGMSPEKSLFGNLVSSAGYLPSLDNEYRVGSVVVAALLRNWDKYRDQVP